MMAVVMAAPGQPRHERHGGSSDLSYAALLCSTPDMMAMASGRDDEDCAWCFRSQRCSHGYRFFVWDAIACFFYPWQSFI